MYLTRFIGRQRELEYVAELLSEKRLVTITGAGGSGKTRLAVEVAGRSKESAAWIDLNSVHDSGLLLEHLAGSLELRQGSGESTEHIVIQALQDRDGLVVLDNCEHLLDAVAELVGSLLVACPRLRILATSREALGVGGEIAWLLPVMTLPAVGAEDVSAVLDCEAVQLFTARARDARPSFVLDEANARSVAELCRRLDGLPLALELAASRIPVLTPQQITERLEDRFRLLATRSRSVLPRHRTLHEVIAWSWAQLEGKEPHVLRRLSIFVGAVSLEAAEALCAGEGIDGEDVLDVIASLVAKSLVVVETSGREARYRLLETVRQYALDRLREAGEEEPLRRRHADFFVEQATARERGAFCGGSDPSFIAWFDSELDELRSAAVWLEQAPTGDDALRLAASLEWYWFIRGRFTEGRRWVERAIAASPDGTPTALGRAEAARALLAFAQGDLKVQREAAGRAVDHLRDAARPASLAQAQALLGTALGFQGDREQSGILLGEAVAAVRAATPLEFVPVLALHGSTAAARGDWAEAATAWGEAAAFAQRLGLPHSEVHLGEALGRLAFVQGDHEAARSRFEQILEIRLEDPWIAALTLQGAGCAAMIVGDHEQGVRAMGAAAATRARLGVPFRPDETEFADRMRAMARDRLAPADFDAAWDRGCRSDPAELLAEIRGEAGDRSRRPLGPAVSSRDPERAPATREPTPAAGTADLESPAATADLAVWALGDLRVAVAGEMISGGAWSQGKPQELLLHLLSHPDGRTREQIGLVFWPDASAAQVRNSFHVLLHRLRKSLGDSAALLVVDGRYRINPEWRVWYDVAVFESQMVRLLGPHAGHGGTIEDFERVLGLYRGHFLQDEVAGDWTLAVHDRVRRLWVDGLSALADLQVEDGDLRGAVRTLERLIREEDLREDAYRRLMLCLARLGERDRAIRYFEGLVLLLREELDAAPEEETVELAKRIRTPGQG